MSRRSWNINEYISQPPLPSGRLRRPLLKSYAVGMENAREALALLGRRYPNAHLTIGTPVVAITLERGEIGEVQR